MKAKTDSQGFVVKSTPRALRRFRQEDCQAVDIYTGEVDECPYVPEEENMVEGEWQFSLSGSES
jgi:hypothetical protein